MSLLEGGYCLLFIGHKAWITRLSKFAFLPFSGPPDNQHEGQTHCTLVLSDGVGVHVENKVQRHHLVLLDMYLHVHVMSIQCCMGLTHSVRKKIWPEIEGGLKIEIFLYWK